MSYNSHLITNQYFECINQYASFFKDDGQFFLNVISTYFSPQGITNQQKSVASPTIYAFKNLMLKHKADDTFRQHFEKVLENVVKVIQACYSNQIPEETLGYEEIKNLLSILSIICADSQPNPENFKAIEASTKLEAINWALNLQIKEI